MDEALNNARADKANRALNIIELYLVKFELLSKQER